MDIQTRLNEALVTACTANELMNVICLMNVGANPMYNEGSPLLRAIFGNSPLILNPLLLLYSDYNNPSTKPILQKVYRIAKTRETIGKGIPEIVQIIKDYYKSYFNEDIEMEALGNVQCSEVTEQNTLGDLTVLNIQKLKDESICIKEQKTVRRQFYYGIEYIFYVPGQTRRAQDILIKHSIPTASCKENFISVIDKFYMLNALRNSSYKLYDSIVQKIDEEELKKTDTYVFCVLRPLDECELIEVNRVLNDENIWIENRGNTQNLLVKNVIQEAHHLLKENGINITQHGWFKVRRLA